jgi:uncharacterized phiE125 gp8 family phage protein
MALKLIAPAAQPIVSLEDMKAHLRVDHADDDPLIEGLVKAATSYFDGWSGILGRALIAQTWELTLDSFPPREMKLPIGPLISVTSVMYDNGDGVEQTLDPAGFDVDKASEPGWVLPVNGWPATAKAINAVRVRFIAGFGEQATDVPEAVRLAIKLHVQTNYDQMDSVVREPYQRAIDALVAPFRRVWF